MDSGRRRDWAKEWDCKKGSRKERMWESEGTHGEDEKIQLHLSDKREMETEKQREC